MADGTMTRARVALGGVGTKPWRSPEAKRRSSDRTAGHGRIFRQAAEIALQAREPQSENGFKVELAKRCLAHALQAATTDLSRSKPPWPTIPDRTSVARSAGDTPRVDGPLKVTGTRAVHVRSPFSGHALRRAGRATIANGSDQDPRRRRRGADAGRARDSSPRQHREDLPRRHAWARSSTASADERRPPFEDDVIRYYGQYVALAVADTFETGQGRGRRRERDVHQGQAERRPISTPTMIREVLVTTFGHAETRCKSERGDADAAFAAAPVKIDQTYVTPPETHNPIETPRDDRRLGRRSS